MKTKTQKLAFAALLTAIAVVGSFISFPVGPAKCAPVQHLVNILAAALGPAYGVGIAFSASLIRLLSGLGTLLAFPGSMCGALLCGLVFRYSRNIPLTCLGEVFGTGFIGALLAYPVVAFIMNKTAALFGFVIPFAVSSTGGAIIAFIVLQSFKKIFKERGNAE